MPCEPAASVRYRCWVAGGLASGAVARRLSIWPHTASTHLRHVSARLGVPNRVALAAVAHHLIK